MRDLCRKFQISSVMEHITALIALYRPGPMDLIPEFIKRRQGEVKIEYEHPLLEPICRETYWRIGMVYQEQDDAGGAGAGRVTRWAARICCGALRWCKK